MINCNGFTYQNQLSAELTMTSAFFDGQAKTNAPELSDWIRFKFMSSWLLVRIPSFALFSELRRGAIGNTQDSYKKGPQPKPGAKLYRIS
jgi:hypothetical protein